MSYLTPDIQSLSNSLKKLGQTFEWVRSPSDLDKAEVRGPLTQQLLFPGVGAFGNAMEALKHDGYAEPLRAYIKSGRPYMGICVGMQALFEGSTESPGIAGLGVVPGVVDRFSPDDSVLGRKAVPHMGWATSNVVEWEGDGRDALARDFGLDAGAARHFYFVHSFRVGYTDALAPWVLGTTTYGDETFVSVVQRDNVFATQFHPERSGAMGLSLLRAWLERSGGVRHIERPRARPAANVATRPTRRIVACLDVRSNDDGDLVVTKGESYDVRERSSADTAHVRNMGKPVELAQRYYEQGADEITFLNITSFREWALGDQPMLALLNVAAATTFVPLTIGGGIRDFTDPDGTFHPALKVAHAYFRAGADKVSIGSEAVYAVERLLERAREAGHATNDPAAAPASALRGDTGIEQIAHMYGAQAVVISIDPKRVYVDEVPPAHAASIVEGPDERPATQGQPARWWYQCTVKGGRETRDIDVVQLARGAERLGAGELLINSIDRDGSHRGFDLQLMDLVRASVTLPVIASSGAGQAKDFTDVFAQRPASRGAAIEAALAAGIFHREQVSIREVKAACAACGFEVRLDDAAA